MSIQTPVTDVDERRVSSRSQSSSERTSGQVSRPDTGNAGGAVDGYQRGYTRPVTSVDADHDDGWHRTADGSWTQHEIGHGPTPRPESTAMGRLAQAGRTGGAGAEKVGRAGRSFFRGVRKRFSKLGKALKGAKKKAEQVNDSVDTAQGNIEDANDRASGLGLSGVSQPIADLGQTVLGGVGAVASEVGDVASDAAPGLGNLKQGAKATEQGSALLATIGRKVKESSTGRAERQDARDHATYLNSERGSRDTNAMHTAVAQQIEAKGVKGTNSLRSDPSPELQNLMDKDTPNLDAKGVVQSGVSEEVQTNFVADQLQRAHDERAGRPPSVENLAHESGNDESSPSPEPSQAMDETAGESSAPERGISDGDDSDSDVWTGQKKKHGAPVSTLGYFSEDIDPTARKYVRGDATTKHLRSKKQYLMERPSKIWNKLRGRGGRKKKTIEAPGVNWDKQPDGTWSESSLPSGETIPAPRVGSTVDSALGGVNAAAGKVRALGKIVAGTSRNDPSKDKTIVTAGAGAAVSGVLAADVTGIGSATVRGVGRRVAGGAKVVQNATDAGATRARRADQINRTNSGAGKADVVQKHNAVLDELTSKVHKDTHRDTSNLPEPQNPDAGQIVDDSLSRQEMQTELDAHRNKKKVMGELSGSVDRAKDTSEGGETRSVAERTPLQPVAKPKLGLWGRIKRGARRAWRGVRRGLKGLWRGKKIDAGYDDE